jgi:hypothetical protein
MVTPEGLLPNQKITNSYVQRVSLESLEYDWISFS